MHPFRGDPFANMAASASTPLRALRQDGGDGVLGCLPSMEMASAAGRTARVARRLAEEIRAEKKVREAQKPSATGGTLRELRAQVVRDDPELVLINKPYGLPVHGGPSTRQSVASLLPALTEMLFGRGSEPLKLCHRLDRDTTGTLILARSTEAAERVQRALRERTAQKVYWALCLGVPSPLEGIIDIPIVERETEGPQRHYKMSLSPRFQVSEDGVLKKGRVCRSAREAVTRYRTAGESAGASLLELRPVTGVKHQLRVHLAFGMNCPILGDHKYSHWGRLAPQKPPKTVLQALGLSAAGARSLLLHLHAAQISLPPVRGDTPIVLRCLPPKFFMSTLRRLQIPPPRLQSIDVRAQ